MEVIITRLPIYMILNMTPWLILSLIFHLIYESLILILLFKIEKIKLKKSVIIRTVVMAWIFGFISDIVSVITLLILSKIVYNVDVYRPYSSFQGVTILLIVMLLAVIMVYFMIKYLLRRVYVKESSLFKVSILFTVLTVPYYVMLPISVELSTRLL